MDPDPERFVPDPDPARMKKQIKTNVISNFRTLDILLYSTLGL